MVPSLLQSDLVIARGQEPAFLKLHRSILMTFDLSGSAVLRITWVQCRAFLSGSLTTRCSTCPWVVQRFGDVALAGNKCRIVGTTSTYTRLSVRCAHIVQPLTAGSTPCDRTYVPSTGSTSSPRDESSRRPCREEHEPGRIAIIHWEEAWDRGTLPAMIILV